MTRMLYWTMAAAALLAGCDGAAPAGEVRPARKRPKIAVEPGRVLAETRFASEGVAGWKISNYRDILTMAVTNVNGEAFLHIGNHGLDPKNGKPFRDTSWTFEGRPFAVAPGGEIAVVVEARGEVSMMGPRTKNGIATALLWYRDEKTPCEHQDPLGRTVPSAMPFGFRSEGAKWLKTVVRTTVPADARFAALKLGGDAPDIAYGKCIQLKRVAVRAREAGGAWDFGDLEPPEYRLLSETPAADPNAEIRFRVTDESAIAKCEVLLDGQPVDPAKLVRRETRDGLEFTLAPVAPWAKESLHLVGVSAEDDCGNASAETLAFFCGEKVKQDVVSLRDDGMPLVNGRAFFPIFPFGFRECPHNGMDLVKGLEELKAGGCNMVASYLMYHGDRKHADYAQYRRLLAACDRTGMKLMVECGGRRYDDPRRAEIMREALVEGRDHNCLFCWGIGDDTASHREAGELRNDRNVIRAVDNCRLTSQADITSYPGRQIPFAKATDVIMNEIYPFRAAEPEPQGLAQVKEYMAFAHDDAAKGGNPNWSVMPLVQAFSGWGLWKRFPTRAEIRAQSYLGIIRGARGVSCYSYFSFSQGANPIAKDPRQMKTFLSVTRELGDLHDDLASRDAKAQPAVTVVRGPAKDLCGAPSVECLLKETGLLVVASSRSGKDDAVTARISGLGAKAAETVFENGRRVECRDGVLTDVFAPGEVHVYRLK